MKAYSILIALFISFGVLSGCNTVKGIGQDIKAGGGAIESTAEKAKK